MAQPITPTVLIAQSDVNSKGEYALWDKGKIIGYAPMSTFQGALVITSIKPILSQMVEDAHKDGINLTLAVGYRLYSKQFALRKQNIIDKSKQNDVNYLLTADSSLFNPKTAKPGYSNHEDGGAYDFNVTGLPQVYAWLVKHAIKYGFIRTVDTERWHWEYKPGHDQFSVILKNHPTWDGLV